VLLFDERMLPVHLWNAKHYFFTAIQGEPYGCNANLRSTCWMGYRLVWFGIKVGEMLRSLADLIYWTNFANMFPAEFAGAKLFFGRISTCLLFTHNLYNMIR